MRSLPLFPEAPVESPGSNGSASGLSDAFRPSEYRGATRKESDSPEAAARATAQRPRPAPLWLCIHLPALPLEIFAPAPTAGPLAVIEQQGGRQVLVALNDCAVRHGLEAGQPLTGAYALAPALEILERNPRGERAALERLAVWAGRFTSVVSLQAPAALLLEVRSSLRLFGGLDALRKEILDGFGTLGHAAERGIAPTPLAALWLARAGDAMPVEEMHALAGRLGRLPLACLGWPSKTEASLREMGLRRIKDCLRLPRDGFARRFGPALLGELDRALGRSPDPRVSYASPPRFIGELELPAEVCDTGLLLEAAGCLLDELGGFLRARESAVQELELEFVHAQREVTPLGLGLSIPSRDAKHLRALFAERLERMRLPAPVLVLRLRSGSVRRLNPVARPLLAEAAAGNEIAREALPKLIERLRARLGEEAVYGLRLVSDHRPETAWHRSEPGGNGDIPDFRLKIRNVPISRPLWMLPEPQRLPQPGGRPSWRGRLGLESGPERIETGWWDGSDVARDYYVAVNPRGMRLWIFRRRRGRRSWYLHGIFG
ncbi:MAG: DNA polymerase Y family protein [Gammaproteobacteria bacterium]|nr:DNA polymerase Y family protein [Gammaproteobacteria bacterium]